MNASASQIRHPAVAGMFYPDDANELRSMLAQYLNTTCDVATPPRAIIAPHAGYIYSGPVAGAAYACLGQLHDTIHRVVLLGPSHRVAFSGIAASSASFFATPLGNIAVDQQAIAAILPLPGVLTLDKAHLYEHSLEVHLPFLQYCLDDFKLVPLVVGDTQPEQVAAVLETLWHDDDTLIVVSSDLSHYHDYATAQQMDARTSNAIVNMRADKIHFEDACGRNPVNGLLLFAGKHQLLASILDVRNSGDTAGPRDQVVGYGAYAFS
jgi:AmmeMemoRadiSam system protein B